MTVIVSNGQGAGQTQEKVYMRINEQNAVAEWVGRPPLQPADCSISLNGKVHETGIKLRFTSTTCQMSYRCELSMKRVP